MPVNTYNSESAVHFAVEKAGLNSMPYKVTRRVICGDLGHVAVFTVESEEDYLRVVECGFLARKSLEAALAALSSTAAQWA